VKKLVILDMDGTVFEHKNLWAALHKAYGTHEEGVKATEELLYTDYAKLIDIVIHNLWKGKPAQPYFDLIASVKYLPGVKETIKELHMRGYKVAIITSGPDLLLERAKRELGIDLGFANTLEVKDGIVTGRSRHDDGSSMWPVQVDNKVPLAERLCETLKISLHDVAAVGDERNDLPLFKAVGVSIAFNTRNAELIAAATHQVEGNDLRKILPLLP